MINIDSKLLAALQQSSCFGIAHDDSVPECKQCDVKAQCKAKVEGANIQPPARREKPAAQAPKAETASKPASKPTASSAPKEDKPKAASKPASAKASKPAAPSNPNLPDFKPMTLEDLQGLAKERSVEWKDYGDPNITRMRLIMALKKSY